MESRAVRGSQPSWRVPAWGATVKDSDSHHAAPWVLSPQTGVHAESRPGRVCSGCHLTALFSSLSSLPQIFWAPHKVSAALERPHNQSLTLSCSHRVRFLLAVPVPSAFDVTSRSALCLSERLSGADPLWTGMAGICGIRRDLRDSLRAQPTPGCSPRHGEPGSPARDKQSVLMAIAPLRAVYAHNSTKKQNIPHLWMSKADVGSAAAEAAAEPGDACGARRAALQRLSAVPARCRHPWQEAISVFGLG